MRGASLQRQLGACPVDAILRRVARCGGNLDRHQLSGRLVHEAEVGEGAADVDAEAERACGAHACLSSRFNAPASAAPRGSWPRGLPLRRAA